MSCRCDRASWRWVGLGWATLLLLSSTAVVASEQTSGTASDKGSPASGILEIRPISEGGTLRVDFREQSLPYVEERDPGYVNVSIRGEKRGEWASCSFDLLPGRTFVWTPDIREHHSHAPPRAAAFRKAQVAMWETRYERALELYRQVIADYPGHCVALRSESAIHRIQALLEDRPFFPEGGTNWRTPGWIEVVSPVPNATGQVDQRALASVPRLESTTTGFRTVTIEAPGQEPWTCLVSVPRNRPVRLYVDPRAEDSAELRPSARLMASADAAVTNGQFDKARTLWERLLEEYPRSCEAHRLPQIMEAFDTAALDRAAPESAAEGPQRLGQVGWLRVELRGKPDRACRKGPGAELRVSIAGRLCRRPLPRKWDLPATEICGPLPVGQHEVSVGVFAHYSKSFGVWCGDRGEVEIEPGQSPTLVIEAKGDCNRFWPMNSHCDLRIIEEP